eukprot:m.44483 g.44483  ORF g.44483 m.44483 type:complete len:1053 (+) comp10100_c0_seq2:215-3373(+)
MDMKLCGFMLCVFWPATCALLTQGSSATDDTTCVDPSTISCKLHAYEKEINSTCNQHIESICQDYYFNIFNTGQLFDCGYLNGTTFGTMLNPYNDDNYPSWNKVTQCTKRVKCLDCSSGGRFTTKMPCPPDNPDKQCLAIAMDGTGVDSTALELYGTNSTTMSQLKGTLVGLFLAQTNISQFVNNTFSWLNTYTLDISGLTFPSGIYNFNVEAIYGTVNMCCSTSEGVSLDLAQLVSRWDLTRSLVNGNVTLTSYSKENEPFFDMSISTIYGDLDNSGLLAGFHFDYFDMSHCILYGDIRDFSFRFCTFVVFSMSYTTIYGNIGNYSFAYAKMDLFELTNLKMPNGSIASMAFHECSVSEGGLDMSHSVILQVASFAFKDFTVQGPFFMRNVTILTEIEDHTFSGLFVYGTMSFENSNIYSISSNAFFQSAIFGDMNWTGSTMGNKLQRHVFSNLFVFGSTIFTGSVFPNNVLIVEQFYGLTTNTLLLDDCNIHELAENTTTKAGPFFGLSLVGSENQRQPILNLANNQITSIGTYAFAGAGTWNINLEDNNITTLKHNWSQTVSSAVSVNMNGTNPSKCSRTEHGPMKCVCRPPTTGTGAYCDALKCPLFDANLDHKHGRYYAVEGQKQNYVNNGEYAEYQCNSGYEIAGGSSAKLKCFGGSFEKHSPLLCNKTPINWELIGEIVGSIVATALFGVTLFQIKRQRDALNLRKEREENVQAVLKGPDNDTELPEEINSLSPAEIEEYKLNKAQYTEALQKASQGIQQDEFRYRTVFAGLVLDKRHGTELSKLDEVEATFRQKLREESSTTLEQPMIVNKEGAAYIAGLRNMFKTITSTFDNEMKKICVLIGCELVMGSDKGNERIFEKAELCYNGNLRRVTDIVRRSFVFERFSHMAKFIDLLSKVKLFTIVRMKNRFSFKKFKHAKDTGGYRDFQIVVRVNENRLLMEIQLHIRDIYQIKVGEEEDSGGFTGHNRYILFRTQKEKAYQLYMSAWDQQLEEHRPKRSGNKTSKYSRTKQSAELHIPLLGLEAGASRDNHVDDISYVKAENIV